MRRGRGHPTLPASLFPALHSAAAAPARTTRRDHVHLFADERFLALSPERPSSAGRTRRSGPSSWRDVAAASPAARPLEYEGEVYGLVRRTPASRTRRAAPRGLEPRGARRGTGAHPAFHERTVVLREVAIALAGTTIPVGATAGSWCSERRLGADQGLMFRLVDGCDARAGRVRRVLERARYPSTPRRGP